MYYYINIYIYIFIILWKRTKLAIGKEKSTADHSLLFLSKVVERKFMKVKHDLPSL